VGREVGVDGVAGDHGVEVCGAAVALGTQHPPEPLGWRLLRALRRQFLSQFEI